MSYAKCQRDPPSGSAAIPEKLMGGEASTLALHGRGLNDISRCITTLLRSILKKSARDRGLGVENSKSNGDLKKSYTGPV